MSTRKKPSEEFKKKAPKAKAKTKKPAKKKEQPYTGGMHYRGNPSKPAYVPGWIRKEQW